MRFSSWILSKLGEFLVADISQEALRAVVRKEQLSFEAKQLHGFDRPGPRTEEESGAGAVGRLTETPNLNVAILWWGSRGRLRGVVVAALQPSRAARRVGERGWVDSPKSLCSRPTRINAKRTATSGDAAADARDGVGGGSHPGARSGRVKRGGLMEEATGDQAGHVGVEAGRLLGREERLFGGRNRLAVGLASAGLALVADTADREHDDSGENAEDHDDD